jgi:hypothetical protein
MTGQIAGVYSRFIVKLAHLAFEGKAVNPNPRLDIR